MLKLYAYILSILHLLLIFIIGLILLFSMNIYTLFLTNVIILVILLVNYKYEDCPITLIEEKYHIPTIELFFSSIGKNYTKNMRSIMTLELLWIGLLLGVEKLLMLLLFKKFILKNIV